jgi:hypothetical protein
MGSSSYYFVRWFQSNVARKNASSGERVAARVDSVDCTAGVINNHRPC